MVEETKNLVETENEEVVWTEETARKALEEAREAENRAYHGMSRAVLTNRQKGVLELAKLEEEENPNQALLDYKCRLILESYYLPRILKEGFTFKLNKEFTRTDEPEKDYIEAVFTAASGKTRNVGYNYKVDKDGKNIILFEKVFQTVVLKPGDPEKYVLYEPDGKTELMTYSADELARKVAKGDIVKVEGEYFRKATNADGDVREGETTMIVEDEGLNNVKIVFGDNEQDKYSFSKNGQLVKATTNDVTTITIETRKIAGPGPVFNSIEDAQRAAAKEVQEGETNLRVDVGMEGSTVAEFDFLPVYSTSIELTGLSKKIGKGVEDYDPNESDEENLRKQLAKPIHQYLGEKGYHILDITCENITADVKENVGWINTMKTYQMTGGTVTVTYIKRNSAVVSLKQGFLGRGQGIDEKAILSQLPEGSELLNPQDIDWKNPKPSVDYVVRGHATGIGSAKSVNEADDAAAQSAISEGQKIAVRGLNGGIASGIREAIDGKAGVSTVANVRARLDTPVVSKNDMELTRREPKYAYTASCDRMVSTTENKLVSVTSWNGSKLVHIPATEPILDKGIPSDENYEKYIKDGDDLGILIFEKSDKGLRRYMDEVKNARVQAGVSITLFEKSRVRLKEAQEIFDKVYDEKVARLAREAEEEAVADATVKSAMLGTDKIIGSVAEDELDEEIAAALAAAEAEAEVNKTVANPTSALRPAAAPDPTSVLRPAIAPDPVSVLGPASAPDPTSVLRPAVAPDSVSVLTPRYVDLLLPLEEPEKKEEQSVPEATPVSAMEPAEDNRMLTAQEALFEIFGESAMEMPSENAVVNEVAGVAAEVTNVESSVETKEQSQEEMDAAFARLLSGEM